ncbi:DUF421 domain-containing protein [Spirosoma linguale]|uniref:YetF C-terminal domain-containing protein n=1 Tax=Spirosoma linguale (strain ATCC 33905 / DSM 74 / LMG 10896 / Claus 1) TaxID=504472 RepID=D2QMI0_SPILD|nr:protein of unknown function DUF421 [Spirosoma linguale DSM 74]
MSEPVQPFDWGRMFIHDLPWTYLGEVAFRTAFMFVILLTALTVSGKREVRQLSIYELVLVIGLGSAAGDPMFYDDVPMASAVVVFIVMMSCYKLATYISDRNKTVRQVLEGKAVYVVENGCILTENFDREDLGLEELFSDLRVEGIEHLGQVRVAILEPNGQLSIFQYKPDEVKFGLPILPNELKKDTEQIEESGKYACCNCGYVESFTAPAGLENCRRCNQTKWVKAVH